MENSASGSRTEYENPSTPVSTFPWTSKSVEHIRHLFESQEFWAIQLFGGDAIEREMLCEALANGAPFFKLDCNDMRGNDFEAKIFGVQSNLANGNRIVLPGLAERLHGGVLLLENFDNLPTSTQKILPAIIDAKQGWRTGPSVDEMVPIQFKMIFASDRDDLDSSFDRRIIHRLLMVNKLEPLSKRPEDLEPVLRRTFKDIQIYAGRTDIRISEEFWEQLRSRTWPFDLGQWVHAIANFFVHNPSFEMTWTRFVGSLSFNLEEFMNGCEQLKRKHEIQKRNFLLERIARAESKDSLLNSIGLSWDGLVRELTRLGMTDSVLCMKLLALPWDTRPGVDAIGRD